SFSGHDAKSAPCAAALACAPQKPDGGVPPGPAGIVLVSTLFWKILVTRVNGKMCAPGADIGLVHPPRANPRCVCGGQCFWRATIANIFRARRLSGSLAALVWRFRSPHHSCSESEMRTSEPKPH